MAAEIIFYDIPSKDPCKSWSPNTMKVRMVLNYKNIPYKTEWLEYPDIAPTLESLGIPPNPPEDFAAYTLPVVRLTDGTFVVDSAKIAERLEQLYPDPPLHLHDEVGKEARTALGKVFQCLGMEHQPRVAHRLLSDQSKSWFIADRERRGVNMDPNVTYDKEWQEAEARLADLNALFTRNDGPFLLGSSPIYADFVINCVLDWYHKFADGSYERLVSGQPALERLHKECQPWLTRDEY